MVKFTPFILVLMLSACGQNDMSDLEKFIQDTVEKPGKGIEPLEKIAESDYFYFDADHDLRNPFITPENMEEEEEEVEEEEVEEIVPVRIPNGIKPDLTRIKQDLEYFPLDTLSMVGTVKTDQLWALVRFEEGVKKVKVGDYVGKNHGIITHISDVLIKLEEIIAEDIDQEWWIKQARELPLKIGIDE